MLKTDMNGNRKIIAGLELLEKTAAGLLQQILDVLQVKIPLTVLLTCVLNQNTGNTIRDIREIVSKVIQSLHMDIEGFDNFVRIYHRDYNDCLHQKAEVMKKPIVFKYGTCYKCRNAIHGDESCRSFVCGHIYHSRCSKEYCTYCEKLKTIKYLEVCMFILYDLQIEKHELLPFTKKEEPENVEKTDDSSILDKWNSYKAVRSEQNSGTLFAIYDGMNGNRAKFTKLLEPPPIFSSVPELPTVDAEMLVGDPQIGSLPIKPSMRGECVLLPNQ